MVGVGRDLCGSSSPTPLPKQGHLQQAAQDLVQPGLEYLQRRRYFGSFWVRKPHFGILTDLSYGWAMGAFLSLSPLCLHHQRALWAPARAIPL